jgi:hypothetical protein
VQQWRVAGRETFPSSAGVEFDLRQKAERAFFFDHRHSSPTALWEGVVVSVCQRKAYKSLQDQADCRLRALSFVFAAQA